MMNRKHDLRIVSPNERSRPGDAMVSLKSAFQMTPPKTPAPANFFWTCATCGPIEPLCLPSGRWIQRSCACQRAARQEQEIEWKRQNWFDEYRMRTYGGWLGESWIDEAVVWEMSAKTFETYQRDRFPDAYDAALAFAQALKGNLILSGSLGTGKSHLEAAIANYLREHSQPRRTGDYGIPSLFATAPQFFIVHDQTKKSFDQTPYLALLQQATETPLLILDDIDKSKPKEERQEVYYHIVNERYKAKRPTVISTNKLEALSDYIGEAAMDRLMRGMISVEMVGSSYRLEEEA
jgi:DNA replication protein DnaC